ncbi:D-alanyl-D-alanine carboxypeptidase family protein [Streptomyces avermitilis]|uniref:D-alanyl-D-alanine carboxypeptidase family protein n=1 Tax=Streptomyces avermitilis TaxID=33903 RepID=UPI0033A324F2
MPASNRTARRRLPVTSAALLSLLTLSLTAPAAAFADGSPTASPTATATGTPTATATGTPTATLSATPPSGMSTIGGDRLGSPGTQVNLGSGAPVIPKDITARSWIVADAESGDVLAAHNAHWRLPPASTLKMLFADTLLPKFPRNTEHKVVPSDLAGMGAGSSVVGIKENETYTVHDLWLGVFLRSGNDAVHVLSAMNKGVDQTVKDMQEHATELQALDTHVVSPDGYDAPRQVSSAYDLTLFARSGLQKKDFREYCATVRAQFPGETTKKKGKTTRGSFEIQNTNRLLAGDSDVTPYQGIAGVKNGNTSNAGATFTGVAERNGKVLLVTVMNPEKNEHNEVYKETAKLLDWGFGAADKVTPVGELVAPQGTDTSAQPGANAPVSPGAGAGKESAKPVATGLKDGGSRGVGIALAVAGGVLVLLVAGGFLVNRRWPLPDLVRRRTRR